MKADEGYSLIMDSNFANIEVAVLNIKRLLKKSYKIKIFYLYDYIYTEPKSTCKGGLHNIDISLRESDDEY